MKKYTKLSGIRLHSFSPIDTKLGSKLELIMGGSYFGTDPAMLSVAGYAVVTSSTDENYMTSLDVFVDDGLLDSIRDLYICFGYKGVRHPSERSQVCLRLHEWAYIKQYNVGDRAKNMAVFIARNKLEDFLK